MQKRHQKKYKNAQKSHKYKKMYAEKNVWVYVFYKYAFHKNILRYIDCFCVPTLDTI